MVDEPRQYQQPDGIAMQLLLARWYLGGLMRIRKARPDLGVANVEVIRDYHSAELLAVAAGWTALSSLGRRAWCSHAGRDGVARIELATNSVISRWITSSTDEKWRYAVATPAVSAMSASRVGALPCAATQS